MKEFEITDPTLDDEIAKAKRTTARLRRAIILDNTILNDYKRKRLNKK